MEPPLAVWVPSIAPSGMAFLTSDRYPGWKGSLFVGSLKYEMLARLAFDGRALVTEERLLKGELGRIRDVRQGPDGWLYLLTDASDGRIVRLELRRGVQRPDASAIATAAAPDAIRPSAHTRSRSSQAERNARRPR